MPLKMKPHEFHKQIKDESFQPVVLFVGLENFWKQLHLKTLRSRISNGKNELNFFRFCVSEDTVESVLNEADGFGFFGEKKIIHYKEIESLSAKDQQTLLDYVASPNQETLLILDASNLDGRSPLAKNEILKASRVNYELTRRKDVEDFIHYQLKNLGGIRLEKKLEEHLIETYPKNLALLANNLEKMAAHSDYREELRLEDLIVSNSFDIVANPFTFLDAILSKDLDLVYRLKSHLAKQKDFAFSLVGLLRWQFETLLQAKSMMLQGMPMEQVGQACKVPSFKRRAFFKDLQGFSEKEIARKIGNIADCDHSLKSTALSPNHCFEMLIHQLCR